MAVREGSGTDRIPKVSVQTVSRVGLVWAWSPAVAEIPICRISAGVLPSCRCKARGIDQAIPGRCDTYTVNSVFTLVSASKDAMSRLPLAVLGRRSKDQNFSGIMYLGRYRVK